PGDYVVHVEHGIGQYEGLKQLFREGGQKDYLLLRYKGKDRLYLPVHRVNLLQKYIGPEQGRIQLDQLGGQSWERRKRRVNEAVEELAGELLKLYAAREIVKGYKFSPPDPFFHEFEGTFEFEETEDQQRAIDEVLEDMCKQKPMDRLVCGDVGYGKTEVALRAAFKSVLDHKQVAVLCPTTLLAAQHERTFKERFKDFPVTIELLSRFRTTREQKEVIKKIERGEIDILIGTHLLLSKRVQFRDLGLVVIDEEQRFGVKQKERLKSLRTEVDILTLTAKPIPRTLSLSLSGLRDLSIINTPPADRHAIKTFVTPFHEEVIRDAILNELQRGGQIFFVHNRVQTIASITRTLQQILPEARFGIAHGQLPERALEKVMSRFLNREIDVLVCSAIIESGLDIPSANTLVVNRADTFGLAQLYQLRGRVGRSKEQAYAYLLIPSDQTITIEAQQRLEVLQRYTEFGSGFRIASHDLELRGGGDILGGEQSGHIAAVGFELYTRLLDEAIRTLRGEKVEPQIEPEIKLQVPAFIPQEYIADTKQRLALYKRLATASSDEELGILRQEMRDRFGPVPNPTENLFQVMCVKHRLQRLRARTLTATADQITLEFDPSTPLKTEQVLLLITNSPNRYSLKPGDRFVIITQEPITVPVVLQEIEALLKTLG
ncbi:MAG TPA: transcription-repair coupling factor, partial [Bdellovibrionota bacterium]|nr:transcription-repair coupling factor [Bdellovibrionota bacterium]